TIDVTGATVGQVFIICVKYSLKELVGYYLNPNYGVHYDFMTVINGQVVDHDPDGLQIGAPATTGVGDDPIAHINGLGLYKPIPNPFTKQTQMVFAVRAHEGGV